MVRTDRISSYLGFELRWWNCIENSTSKPRGMEIWFELPWVPVIQGSSYRSYTVDTSPTNECNFIYMRRNLIHDISDTTYRSTKSKEIKKLWIRPMSGLELKFFIDTFLIHSRKIRNTQLRFVFLNFSFVCQNHLCSSEIHKNYSATLVIVIIDKIIFREFCLLKLTEWCFYMGKYKAQGPTWCRGVLTGPRDLYKTVSQLVKRLLPDNTFGRSSGRFRKIVWRLSEIFRISENRFGLRQEDPAHRIF